MDRYTKAYVIVLDQEANRAKQPATHKIASLKHVAELLHKTRFGSAFVNQGGFTAIRKWLQPLPDKSMPSLNIREQLLEVLFLVYSRLLHALPLLFPPSRFPFRPRQLANMFIYLLSFLVALLQGPLTPKRGGESGDVLVQGQVRDSKKQTIVCTNH